MASLDTVMEFSLTFQSVLTTWLQLKQQEEFWLHVEEGESIAWRLRRQAMGQTFLDSNSSSATF